MIIAASLENAHLYGNILPAVLKLRHKAFKERLNYSVPSYKGMEFDQYDTPAATYLVWKDLEGQVRATTRVNPTELPYMVGDLWPDLVQTIPIPCSPDIWEASRFCIDKDLDPKLRKQAHAELLCAFNEFAFINNIKAFIGVMSPRIWTCTFERYGWPIEYVGKPKLLDNGEKIVAGLMHVSAQILMEVQNKTGIKDQIISNLNAKILEVA